MRAHPGEQWRQPAHPPRSPYGQRPPYQPRPPRSPGGQRSQRPATRRFDPSRDGHPARDRRPAPDWEHQPARAANPRLRWLRGLTGTLAFGLVVVAFGLLGAQFFADGHRMFGPGVSVVTWHFVAGAMAVGLQALADRRRDVIGTLAAPGVLVVVIGVLWIWWLQ